MEGSSVVGRVCGPGTVTMGVVGVSVEVSSVVGTVTVVGISVMISGTKQLLEAITPHAIRPGSKKKVAVYWFVICRFVGFVFHVFMVSLLIDIFFIE